jgi:hypothetical protein
MHAKYALLSIILMLSLAQLSAASTVTLTGTCSASIINQSSNYLTFNISNSGDGAATSLLLAPQIGGATTSNLTATIPLVSPGSNYTTKFYLSNFTEPGSYADYLMASYSQGASTFVTVFPCLVNLMEKTQSLLQITDINRTGSRLNVTVVNIAEYPIDTNVIIKASPAFKVQPAQVPLHMDPNSQSTAVFNISVPDYTGAQFPVVAAVSYSNSGVHYATLKFTVVNFAAQSNSSLGVPVVTIGIVAVIIILLVLILISFLKKRPKRPKAHQPAANKVSKPDAAAVAQ